VEIYGELKNWDKVSELQSLFTRRYASDKGRLIQALCLGGTAAYNRDRMDEAARLMSQAVRECAALRDPDAGSRFYAAQAQHTLGEIAAARMRALPIRPESRNADVKAKTASLKAAVDAYLKVLDYRIVDWALRAAFSLGSSFEDFGAQVYRSPRPAYRSAAERLDREEEAMSSLSAAFARAQQQYLQVLAIARKQNINNRWVGEASARLTGMAVHYLSAQKKAMQDVSQSLQVDAATPEKAIAGKLQQIGRITPYHDQGVKYFEAFFGIAQDYDLDPGPVDTLGGDILASTLSLGCHYRDAADLARAAPIPQGFQPMERFFYQVKLVREGIPRLEDRAIGYFRQGIDFAVKYNLLRSPAYDSLRASLGRAVYVQAKCLDLLSREALVRPPLPPEAGPEQRKTFQEKIETVGYELQDSALEKYRNLVALVTAGQAPETWGELAFARLYQSEPDKWSRTAIQDTSLDVYTGREWTALPALPPSGWPAPGAPEWRPVRKGVMPDLAYPEEAKAAPRFLWCGDRGQGPVVDGVQATYLPWKRVFAQTRFDLPAQVEGLEFLVVGRPDWAILIDQDTVITDTAAAAGWVRGAARDVWPALSSRLKPGPHFLRLAAENAKPADGFGVWVRMRIRCRLPASGPMFPWNRASPDPGYLKSLLERDVPIPNFTNGPEGR
jgi:hypothetical protein